MLAFAFIYNRTHCFTNETLLINLQHKGTHTIYQNAITQYLLYIASLPNVRQA